MSSYQTLEKLDYPGRKIRIFRLFNDTNEATSTVADIPNKQVLEI